LLFWPGRVLVIGDQVLRAKASASIISVLPLAPQWDVVFGADGCRLESQGPALEVVVLRGRIIEAKRGEYPDCPGWVADGFGRGHGRFSLKLSPAPDGRLLYAVTAPDVGIAENSGELTIASGGHLQRLAVEALLP
jgi:hypothetical protein